MGDKLGSATDMDRLFCVFRTVRSNINVDRERMIFGAVTQILGQKCRQKLAILSVIGYLGDTESDS